jgi:hypothetical protein
MLDRLMRSGYLPYRLGIQSMDALPSSPEYDSLLATLKQAVDPNEILAPRRYVPMRLVDSTRQQLRRRPRVRKEPRVRRAAPPTLEDCLHALRGSLSPSLIDEEALAALGRIAAVLPPEFGRAPIFLECPLGTPKPVADLSVSAWTALDGPDALLALSAAMEQSEAARWEGMHAFAAEWANPDSQLYTAVDEVWLEFDVDPAGSAIPLPSVFFSPRPGPGSGIGEDGGQKPADRARSVAVSAVELLTGEALQPARQRLLQLCFDELPPPARVGFVGAMLPRATSDLRLIIQGLPLDQIPPYLQRVGLPRGIDEVSALLSDTGTHLDSIWLAIDAGEVVGPRVGLECYRTAQNASSWRGLLNYLVEQDLCLPEKAGALLAYARRRTELDGRPLWRQIHHLKLASRAGGKPEAKAYLAASLTPPPVQGTRRP